MPLPSIVADNAFGADCKAFMLKMAESMALPSPQNYRSQYSLLGYDGFFRSQFTQPYTRPEVEFLRDRDGNLRTAELYYYQEDAGPAIAGSALTPCGGTIANTPWVQSTIAPTSFSVWGDEFFISKADFEKTCIEGADEAMTRLMQSKFNRINNAIEQDMIATIYAGAGGNAAMTGTPGETFSVTAAINADGMINANAFHAIRQMLRYNELPRTATTPGLIFGYANPLHKIQNIAEFGGMSDLGANQAALSNLMRFGLPFYSRNVDAAYATLAGSGPVNDDETALVIVPGSAHMIEYYRYSAETGLAYNHGDAYTNVIRDMTTGEWYDMKAVFDCDREGFRFTFWKTAKAYVLPTNLYTGDLTGVNGVFRMEVLEA